jgi:4-hydroxybenzoate polyprenyltransferase/phosphoserine phosphatase
VLNAPSENDAHVPLCVDLDGTLIRSDVLWESFVELWRRPRDAAQAVVAFLSGGKARFKTAVALAVPTDPAALPYRQDLLEFLQDERKNGRDVVLATATHKLNAERIASHLGVFTRVFASEDGVNLRGDTKRAVLEKAYGPKGFDYAGDSVVDLPVFSSARRSLLVSPSASLARRVAAAGTVERVFPRKPMSLFMVLRAMRVHQWAKNILIAVPLLAAHRVWDLGAWGQLALAFVAFGVVASGTYIFNDILDIRADRAHTHKRRRAIAAGDLQIPSALLLAGGLVALGFTMAATVLGRWFTVFLAIYMVLTLSYSLYLKQRLLVDVLGLSFLYMVRILAGSAVTGVMPSEWLLTFSLFIFVSLAFLKRVIEVTGNPQSSSSRSYAAVDMDTMRIVGVGTGLLAVLVFALYINNPEVRNLYRLPEALWMICPLMLYWIARIWFMAARGEVHHDPVVFALLDKRSYVIGLMVVAVAYFAKVGIGVR